MTTRFRTRHAAALALTLIAAMYAVSAAAQWAWKEENGRVVYSDRPPPPNVKIQILRQPSNSTPVTESQPAGSADASKAGADKGASNAPKTLAERDMEFRKRQQERADSERKAQEEQQKTAAKAADCERSRGYLKSLEDGVRIAKTDASGNREYLDDAQRAAETDRARKLVEATCK
jgi:uncharacterized protein DUF4124